MYDNFISQNCFIPAKNGPQAAPKEAKAEIQLLSVFVVKIGSPSSRWGTEGEVQPITAPAINAATFPVEKKVRIL